MRNILELLWLLSVWGRPVKFFSVCGDIKITRMWYARRGWGGGGWSVPMVKGAEVCKALLDVGMLT